MMCENSVSSFEEQTMSSIKSPSKNGRTWSEQMNLVDCGLDSSESTSTPDSSINLSKTDASQSLTDNGKPERELELEFIDNVNENKFERLIKEEKINTQFKRRHSNTSSNIDDGSSRSSSPNSEENNDGEDLENIKGDGSKKSGVLNLHMKEKRMRINSFTSSTSSGSSTSNRERDPAVLARRQKQIDYGKNTAAYERYVEMVPRSDRTKDHPNTPNKNLKYSRRAFDGLVKIWRKQLHHYDLPQSDTTKDRKDATYSSDDSDSD